MKNEIKVTAAVIIKNGKILLAQRGYGKMAGKWEFPGGKVEEAETPQMCLKRELKEEMGVDAVVGELLMDYKYDYKDAIIHLFFFMVKDFNGEIKLSSHSAAEWVAFSDILKYDLLPADYRFAESLIKGNFDAYLKGRG